MRAFAAALLFLALIASAAANIDDLEREFGEVDAELLEEVAPRVPPVQPQPLPAVVKPQPSKEAAPVAVEAPVSKPAVPVVANLAAVKEEMRILKEVAKAPLRSALSNNFDSFPLDRDVAFYRAECFKNPQNRLACSARARERQVLDNQALAEAKANGWVINLPTPKPGSKNDYVIDANEVPPGDSDIVSQLKNLRKRANDADAEKKQAEAIADAAAAAGKAAAEKAAAESAAAAKVASDKAAAEAVALKAKQDAAAAEAKRLADAEAAAAAAKAKADAEAAGKSAAEAAAAAAKAKAEADAAAAAAAAKAKADADAAAAAAAAKAKADAAAAQAAADAAAAAAAAKAKADAEAAAAAAKPKFGVLPSGVLTAPNGMTMYFFEATPNSVSSCTDACRPHWPPVTSGPVAPPGFPCTISFVTRPDTGDQQVTCNGKLLYFSDTDTQPGTANGHKNGFGFVSAR